MPVRFGPITGNTFSGTSGRKANLNRGAGLDVSPAVRDYLGLQDTDVTDWKFVEFSEVPPGPWARLGDNNTFVINQRKARQQLVKAKEKSSVIFALGGFLRMRPARRAKSLALDGTRFVRVYAHSSALVSRSPVRRNICDAMARAIHTFDNGVRVYEDQLLEEQRARYRKRNVHEAEEEEIFVDLIRRLPPDGCFVDVGAAIGYYLILARKLSPRLTIHGVEPLERHRAFPAREPGLERPDER